MKLLLDPELAKKYNLTGQKDKRGFQNLALFQILFGMLQCTVDIHYLNCSSYCICLSLCKHLFRLLNIYCTFGMSWCFNQLCVLVAAKQNVTTKNSNLEMLEAAMQTWFANARDGRRGGGERSKEATAAESSATAANQWKSHSVNKLCIK